MLGTIFIPKGKYPMPWSLDDWCNKHIGEKKWYRSTKWDDSVPAPVHRILGQVYVFETGSAATMFALKWL